jgi:hypothetical protein
VVCGVELELEPSEAAAALDLVATPAVRQSVDEQEAVAALRLEPVARPRSVRSRVEDLDADLLVGRGDPDLDRLVLSGAAVLNRVRDELREKQREPVPNRVRKAASTDRIDRRARPAARVPPGTQNETVFVSMMTRADGTFRPANDNPYQGKSRPPAPLP